MYKQKNSIKLPIRFSVTRSVSAVLVVVIFVYLLHPGRFASYYPYINENDIISELVPSHSAIASSRNNNLSLCSWDYNSSNLELLYPEDLSYDKSSYVISGVSQGGKWKPQNCASPYEVAIIVPYRNRKTQLHLFLSYMHPFLQKQKLSYRIIVVEQSSKGSFNRGKLFNIGFVEILKIYPYECFIFQDVDLIPQNENNIYACTRQPRHMSSSLNTFRYNLPYEDLFGGAVAFLKYQFELINGFSNIYFGWGGEDDDLFNRIENRGLKMCRFPPHVARYIMLDHTKEQPSDDRFINLKTSKDRISSDGLSSLKYSVKEVDLKELYTKILVDIV